MTWSELAEAVAQAWARPRVGNAASGVPLEYCAERAYWQASHLCNFTGSLDDWLNACEAALQNYREAPRPTAKKAEVPPPRASGPPAAVPPSPLKPASASAADLPPPLFNPFGDL